MNDIEKAYHRSMLFDFYGELLTDHQREIYDSFVNEDISISEIALMHDKTRQSVHDLIRRIDGILEGYESKLHMMEVFEATKLKIEKIRCEAESFSSDGLKAHVDNVRIIADEILAQM